MSPPFVQPGSRMAPWGGVPGTSNINKCATSQQEISSISIELRAMGVSGTALEVQGVG
ncbi:hypothetical protein MMC31_001436, partial [Peltigera leucophlebia]|nr:hypothetical protein [Peltigera leucophlebia]